MYCPFCRNPDTQVIDSRASEGGFSIRRRRSCPACGKRFTTYERVEYVFPAVIKRDGSRVDYDRHRVRSSMELALRKRPISRSQVDDAVVRIDQRLISLGEREVASETIGRFVLDELRQIDKIAYIRFASVYFNVERPEAFYELLQQVLGPEEKRG